MELGLLSRGRGRSDSLAVWRGVLKEQRLRGDGDKIKVAEKLIEIEERIKKLEEEGVSHKMKAPFKKVKRASELHAVLQAEGALSERPSLVK